MLWEQEAAKCLEIPWTVRMFCPEDTVGPDEILVKDFNVKTSKGEAPGPKLLSWIRLRRNYYQWLLHQESEVDIFLNRYYIHDPFQIWFLLNCKKPVYFVHHTLEVPELAVKGDLIGKLRATLESLLGPIALKRAHGICGVTQEILDYESSRVAPRHLKNFLYPNGVTFQNNPLPDRRTQDVPEFLFVANFAPWHGLDLLLKAVEDSSEKFLIHIVGEVPSKLLTYKSDSRCRFHGPLKNEEIKKLSELSWIGLSSFALHRQHMRQACPLKTREYLELGLPVYGSYNDVFPQSFPFYQKGSVCISEMLDFAKRVRPSSKQEVAEAARPYIDKSILLSKLYSELSEDFR
jgi:glycosyltransferase involved in cell wall biosynthesis